MCYNETSDNFHYTPVIFKILIIKQDFEQTSLVYRGLFYYVKMEKIKKKKKKKKNLMARDFVIIQKKKKTIAI